MNNFLTCSALLWRKQVPTLQLFTKPGEGPCDSSDSDFNEVPENDYAVVYCQIVMPAFQSRSMTAFRAEEVPNADGAVVRKFLRCPSDISLPGMTRFVRFPELIQVSRTEIVPVRDIAGPLARIVNLSMYGELVVGEDVDGRPSPMMASMDRGDLYYRFIVTHGEEDTPARQTMCSDNRCHAGQLWKPAEQGEIRWCNYCRRWMHVFCLASESTQVDITQVPRKTLSTYRQQHLGYLKTIVQGKDVPPRPHLPLGIDYDVDQDIHDKLGKVAWKEAMPKWVEIACLPIRRRTFPGKAPQTIELYIRHAISMCAKGQGNELAPEPTDIDREITGLESSLRAIKFITIKEIRKLRGVGGIVRYNCIGCSSQIL
ncbi:hypothetical protein FB107DRAFT_224854 [Schizophyllum commune]